MDFRAAELRRIAEENGILGEHTQLVEAIHAEFLKVTGRKGICLNIDGMMAALILDMGFRPIETTAIALLSVLPGIMAHAIEEITETKAFKFFPAELTEYIGPSRQDLPQEQKAQK